jgi:hypothetical protein
MVFIAKGVSSSLQRELDSFYKELTGSEFNIRSVTKGAFSQARAKLNPNAFKELNEVVVDTFYHEAPYLTWKGMRVLAVDGTTLALPNHSSVKEEFGEHGFGPKADSKKSLARASLLYDPLNLLTLDAQIDSFSTSEITLLYKHLEKADKKDLLLFDRLYASLKLIFMLTARGNEFCFRMQKDWWLEVKNFTESSEQERIVKFKLPKKDWEALSDYPEIRDKEIPCRLVKVQLPDGELEILCTSLTDSEEYSIEDLAELYHLRWSEEEGYKLLKARIEVENFSGKTAWAVKQDFYAKIFIMSLCADLAFPIEEKVRKEFRADENRKHAQQINHTSALAMTFDICIKVFIQKMIKQALEAFDDLIFRTREVVRPGRKVPRPKKKKRSYYMNYKPL